MVIPSEDVERLLRGEELGDAAPLLWEFHVVVELDGAAWDQTKRRFRLRMQPMRERPRADELLERMEMASAKMTSSTDPLEQAAAAVNWHYYRRQVLLALRQGLGEVEGHAGKAWESTPQLGRGAA